MLGSLRRVVPRFVRRSYALKFAISIFVIGLVVLALGVVATQGVTGDVKKNTLDRQETTAETEAEVIEGIHQRNLQYVEMAVETKLIEDYEAGDRTKRESVEEYVHKWNRELPAFVENVHFVNVRTGEIIASSAGSTNDINENPGSVRDIGLPESVDLEERGKRQPYATAPFQGGADGKSAPLMAYIRHGPERYGVVYTTNISIYPRIYQRRAGRGVDTTAERTSVIVDISNDNRITLTDRPDTFRQLYQTRYDDRDSIIRSARESSNATGATSKPGAPPTLAGDPYNFDPNGYVVGWKKLTLEDSALQYDNSSDQGLILLVHTSKSDTYGFVNDVRRNGLLFTGAGFLLVIGLGWIVGRNTAQSIDRLTEKAEAMEEGELDLDFDTPRVDNIGRLYDGFASMRDALKIQIQEARDARMEAVSERERVEEINDDLERAAVEYRDVMGQAADGDLTVRAETETNHEAMETIGEEFNEMLDEIEQTVEDLKQFAREVATASEEVTASSQEVKSASENVTESTKRISEGASRQSRSLQSVNTEMSELSTTIQQIASSSNQVADIAAETARTGNRGRKAAKNALDAMAEVRTNATAAADEINQLEAEVEQIDQLIASIAEIAEQTNMLALNANIEASRAQGEAEGEGFGVVAQEVKELSTDTKETAEEIEKRLESIRKQTRRSATKVERTSDDIVEQVDAVEEAAIALDEIADYAEQTNDGVQEISAATEQQAASTQEVVSTVEHAASISEKTADEIESVAAAAKQQTDALTEVSRGASDLAQQASQLSEALDRFNTDAGGGSLDDIIDIDGGTDPVFLDDDRAVIGADSSEQSKSAFETPDVTLEDGDGDR
jgi:methyl-accepting chemotaxis protein